jgi:hypothetical protein
MTLELGVCEDADMHRCFEILSTAFGSEHEYINVLFPSHETSSGRIVGGQRLLHTKHTDPVATFIKVTDTSTGEIIGIAKWNIYNDVIPPEMGLGTTEFWDSKEMAEYADSIYRAYLKERRAATRESGGHLVCMSPFAIAEIGRMS